MNYGRTWNYMLDKFFPSIRNASAILVTIRKKYETPEPEIVEKPVEDTKQTETVVEPEPIIEVDTTSPAYFAIKTNMLYDALLVPNIGVEVSLGKRWTVAADWMYGWWNHNNNHRYWRIYGGGLSVRKYFGAKATEKPLQGHHIGLNAQMLTYDFEFGGKGYMGGVPGGTLWDRMSYTVGAEYGYSMPIAKDLTLTSASLLDIWADVIMSIFRSTDTTYGKPLRTASGLDPLNWRFRLYGSSDMATTTRKRRKEARND